MQRGPSKNGRINSRLLCQRLDYTCILSFIPTARQTRWGLPCREAGLSAGLWQRRQAAPRLPWCRGCRHPAVAAACCAAGVLWDALRLPGAPYGRVHMMRWCGRSRREGSWVRRWPTRAPRSSPTRVVQACEVQGSATSTGVSPVVVGGCTARGSEQCWQQGMRCAACRATCAQCRAPLSEGRGIAAITLRKGRSASAPHNVLLQQGVTGHLAVQTGAVLSAAGCMRCGPGAACASGAGTMLRAPVLPCAVLRPGARPLP